MTRRYFALFAFYFLLYSPAIADLPIAIADTRDYCVGISDNVKKLQIMAGVNTAVSGIGTVAAGGALYAGIQKTKMDKLAEDIEKAMERVNEMGDAEFFHLLGKIAEWNAELNSTKNDNELLQKALDDTNAKSERLGNWRTGLLAGNTAANIGGIIISHKNKNDGAEISDLISGCVDAVKRLRDVSMQALIDGADAGTLVQAQEITEKCGRYSTKDADGIPKWQDVAKWSSIAGIATGSVGVATSIAANIKSENTENKDLKKGLNATSNILAGASMVAGGVSVGFNIATLARINRILTTAEECEKQLTVGSLLE